MTRNLFVALLLSSGCGAADVDVGSHPDDGSTDATEGVDDDTGTGGSDGGGGTDDTSSNGGGTTNPFDQCPPSEVAVPASVAGALSIDWNMIPLVTHTFELRSGVAFLECGSRAPRILLSTDDIDCADPSTVIDSEVAHVAFDPTGATSIYLFWDEGFGQQASFSTTLELPFSSGVVVPAADEWVEGETISGTIAGDYALQLVELMGSLGFEKDDATVVDAKFTVPFCGEID